MPGCIHVVSQVRVRVRVLACLVLVFARACWRCGCGCARVGDVGVGVCCWRAGAVGGGGGGAHACAPEHAGLRGVASMRVRCVTDAPCCATTPSSAEELSGAPVCRWRAWPHGSTPLPLALFGLGCVACACDGPVCIAKRTGNSAMGVPRRDTQAHIIRWNMASAPCGACQYGRVIPVRRGVLSRASSRSFLPSSSWCSYSTMACAECRVLRCGRESGRNAHQRRTGSQHWRGRQELLRMSCAAGLR